jgi:hypothetical protein
MIRKTNTPPSRQRTDNGTEKVGRILCNQALIELRRPADGSFRVVITDTSYWEALNHAYCVGQENTLSCPDDRRRPTGGIFIILSIWITKWTIMNDPTSSVS